MRMLIVFDVIEEEEKEDQQSINHNKFPCLPNNICLCNENYSNSRDIIQKYKTNEMKALILFFTSNIAFPWFCKEASRI